MIMNGRDWPSSFQYRTVSPFVSNVSLKVHVTCITGTTPLIVLGMGFAFLLVWMVYVIFATHALKTR